MQGAQSAAAGVLFVLPVCSRPRPRQTILTPRLGLALIGGTSNVQFGRQSDRILLAEVSYAF